MPSRESAHPKILYVVWLRIRETPKGFWQGWLVEPLVDIAKTACAGGEGNPSSRKGALTLI
jgi:hypothetical protein